MYYLPLIISLILKKRGKTMLANIESNLNKINWEATSDNIRVRLRYLAPPSAISEYIGINVCTLNDWYDNVSKPSVDELFQIAVMLNIKVDDLIISNSQIESHISNKGEKALKEEPSQKKVQEEDYDYLTVAEIEDAVSLDRSNISKFPIVDIVTFCLYLPLVPLKNVFSLLIHMVGTGYNEDYLRNLLRELSSKIEDGDAKRYADLIIEYYRDSFSIKIIDELTSFPPALEKEGKFQNLLSSGEFARLLTAYMKKSQDSIRKLNILQEESRLL